MKTIQALDTTLTTSVRPTTTAPAVLPQHLDVLKRDQSCATLNGYPNAQPPICAGQASICTVSSGRQGCCNGSGSCTFYSSCNGGFAASPCTASGCLQCPSALPYCARYAMTDSSGGTYEGYGCLVADVGNSVIYGAINTAVISSNSKSTSSTTTISKTTSTSTSPASSGTQPSNTTTGAAAKSKLNIPAIAGGAAGGAVLILLIVLIVFRKKIFGSGSQNEKGRYKSELQQ